MDYEKIVNDVRKAMSLGKDDDVLSAVKTMTEQAQRLASVEEDRDALGAKFEAEEARATELQTKVDELSPLADDGRTYRHDLVTEAMAEGVRAYGDKFDSETYEDILRNAPLGTIKRMRTDWQTLGDKNFPAGRKTTDDGEQAPQNNRKRVHVPASAYKV